MIILKTFVFVCTKCEFIYKINVQESVFLNYLFVYLFIILCVCCEEIKIFHKNLCILKYIILRFVFLCQSL